VTTLLLEVVSDLELVRDHWERLAEESGNLFAVWQWNALWWRFFGRSRRLTVVMCRDPEDEVRAIVPLYRWRKRPLTILRFLGHGHGDLLGPVCSRDDGAISAEALRLALDKSQFDIFVGDWLLADRDWASLLGGRVVRETGYPILRFEVDSWDEFLASRSKNFRKDIRYQQRRLEREHRVHYRMTTDTAELERDLDTVFALHRARFDGHGGCYFCGESELFHREFAAAALEEGWLRLWILEVDGEPVATEYGFQFSGSYFAYQTGRDPAWERASVGAVLETYTIRKALEGGAREYRFLRGSEPYKYRLASEDPELEAIGVAHSRRGSVALASAASLRQVQPIARLAKRIAG
jgi:CelD/BcsL family acetyltransferase involved in cellulose biosynthesis